MTTPIQQFIESWLFDPTVGKLVSATVAILIVMALVRVGKGVLTRYIRELGNLYRGKKIMTFHLADTPEIKIQLVEPQLERNA